MIRVGWVGLGAMGLPMARCVARAGYKVAAYDIDPGRASSLAADGVKPAASISVAASGADVLVLMVATPGQVEDVLFGDDPADSALAPGTVVLVMATVGPAAVQHWAGRLAEQQVVVVDGCNHYSTPWPAARRWWDRRRATGRRSSSSTNCCAAYTSRSPLRLSPSPKRCASIPLPPGRSYEEVRQPPSWWTTAANGWCTAPTRQRARWTSSSRTWDSCSTRLAQAAIPRRWRPPLSSCISPAVAQDSADMTTRPSSRSSAAARLRLLVHHPHSSTSGG
jgi:hypothetical protein